MHDLFVPAFGVLMLGITTTLHPCPLTTNIAAISLISGESAGRKRHLGAVIGFSFGYLLAFVLLAVILSYSFVSIPRLSLMLQRMINAFLGPLLILVGMILARLINLNGFYKSISLTKNQWIIRKSFFSSLILGIILAFTFCPATASIFFGVMIPLSVKHQQSILFPVLYATGALLPIITLSILIYRGFGRRFQNRWALQFTQVAGWVLIILGIYITLEQLYI